MTEDSDGEHRREPKAFLTLPVGAGLPQPELVAGVAVATSVAATLTGPLFIANDYQSQTQAATLLRADSQASKYCRALGDARLCECRQFR
jgi:hypothetical protein